MLNIVEVYQTSKGFFLTMEEASLKINRKKVSDAYDRWGPHTSSHEPVKVRQALTTGTQYFLLDEIKLEA